MKLFDVMKSVSKALFGKFRREEVAAPVRRGAEIAPKVARRHYLTNTKVQNRIAWCRAFNVRNGFIVPTRSAGSMYDKFRKRQDVLEVAL